MARGFSIDSHPAGASERITASCTVASSAWASGDERSVSRNAREEKGVVLFRLVQHGTAFFSLPSDSDQLGPSETSR